MHIPAFVIFNGGANMSAKLFLRNTPLGVYELQMQTIPRYELTHQNRSRQRLI